MSNEAAIASMALQIEQLQKRVDELEARQNPDIRIQNFMPERAQPFTVWIWYDLTENSGEWIPAKVLVKRSPK